MMTVTVTVVSALVAIPGAEAGDLASLETAYHQSREEEEKREREENRQIAVQQHFQQQP